MSGPVNPPLKITDTDGTPDIRPAREIIFNSSDFTLTESSSGTASISIASGAGSSLTDTYVGFGDSSNELTGSASLTFDDTNKKLTLTGDADNDTVFEIIGSDTAADAGPRLRITNDSGTDSALDLLMDNFAVGILEAGTPGGTMRSVMQFGQMSSDSYTVVFNEDGLTADFRIESQGNANLFYVDGGQDNVGIGTVPTSGYAGVVPRLHIEQPTDGIGVLIESDEDDADVGPQIVYYRNSDNPAADDILGRLRWEGKDSGGNIHMYGRQTNEIISPTDGQESGRMIWESRSLGTLYECMRFEGNDITFNYAGSSEVDLLIKGDNDDILFADASQDNLGIGTSSPASDVERLHIKGTGDDTLVRLESTETGAGSAPELNLYRSATAATDDVVGQIRFQAKSATGSINITAATLYTQLKSVSGTAMDSVLHFDIRKSNSSTSALELGNTEAVFNEGGLDIDFRVEADSGVSELDAANALVLQGSSGRLGLGTNAPQNQLHIKNSSDSTLLMLEQTEDDTSAAPSIYMWKNRANPANADNLGIIYWAGEDSNGDRSVFASMRVTSDDITYDSEDASISFYVRRANSDRQNFRIRYSEVVVNEDGTDCDFRVQASGKNRMFGVDSATAKVFVGDTGTSTWAQLQVDEDASFYLPVNGTQHTVNYDVQVHEAHGGVLIMKSGSGTKFFNLPDAVAGMHCKLINIGAGMNVTVATGDTINGTLNGELTTDITTSEGGIELICWADNYWACYPLNPLATS